MTASDNKKIGEIVGGFTQTEPDWKTRTKGQEDSFFYYGKGMQDKFVSASKLLTDYIGEKYGARVEKSILENRLIVANRKPPKKIKKEDELKLMKYDDRILWERQHKKYYSLVEEITDDLSKVFHLLLGHCYQTLIVRMRSDKEFMTLDGNESAGQLWRIITKLCDGTNVGEHPLRTALESLFNLFLIRGDELGIQRIFCNRLINELPLQKQQAGRFVQKSCETLRSTSTLNATIDVRLVWRC